MVSRTETWDKRRGRIIQRTLHLLNELYARAAILAVAGDGIWVDNSQMPMSSEFYLNARIVGKFAVNKVRETTPTQIQNTRLKQLVHNLKKI